MNSFPAVYCPRGMDRPAVCPHRTSHRLRSEAIGPDGQGGGTVHGFPDAFQMPPSEAWLRSPAGWYLYAEGHRPQHLQRAGGHRAIRRWGVAAGAQPEHQWAVPILYAPLTGAAGEETDLYVSALDHVLGADGWQPPADLRDLMAGVAATIEGRPLADTVEDRDAACARLAIECLAIGHHVDADLLITLGWLSEDLVVRVLRVATGRTEEP